MKVSIIGSTGRVGRATALVLQRKRPSAPFTLYQGESLEQNIGGS